MNDRKEYLKAYQRQWMRKRRAEYFNDKVCVRCGSTEQLELDHIDPKQKTTHRVWSLTKATRDAEIAKCQVLCRPCHQQKTFEDFGWTKPHGTRASYQRRGCRCGECRRWNADRVARERTRDRIRYGQTYRAPASKRVPIVHLKFNA